MITIIAAIAEDRGIGYQGNLLVKIPEDMSHFKNYTMGKPVIMGSNTCVSLGTKPLPGRKNIVLTTRDVMLPGFIVAKSLKSALSIEHCYDELVIIGGAELYEQTIRLAHKLVITHIQGKYQADTFFPEICPRMWTETSSVPASNGEHSWRIVEYTRNAVG